MLRRLWDYEITPQVALKQRWVPAWAIVTMVGYVLLEVVLLAPATVIGLSTYFELSEKGFAEPTSYSLTIQIFPWLFISLMVLNVAFRIFFGLEGYFFNRRKGLDQGQFWRNLLLYNPASVMTLGFHFLIASLVGLILMAFGYSFADGLAFILATGANLREWIGLHIPTLIALPEKWMAGLAAVLIGSLIGYFDHWISHKNRFLWHVVHGPHHLPDTLHPLGAPLAYSFELFFIPLRIVSWTVLTKLVYAEPMLLETALFAMANYFLEIFNHSTVHYKIVAKSKILRFFTRLGGGQGAYHYLHHSSAENHQMVNFGPGIWMLWDRIFRTFEEPPTETPSVGWTGNPDIHHNPLRVVFGGPARIWFELRHNAGLRVKLKILLGSVYWNPPQTIDYLKKIG